MSSEVQLVVKTVVGILGGLLIASGVLPAGSKDVFTMDVSTVAGYAITVISTLYLLEHALVKVKDDMQYESVDPSALPAKEEIVSPPPPAQPAA